MRHPSADVRPHTAEFAPAGTAQRARLALIFEPLLRLGLRPASVAALAIPTVAAMVPNLSVVAGVDVVSRTGDAGATNRTGRPRHDGVALPTVIHVGVVVKPLRIAGMPLGIPMLAINAVRVPGVVIPPEAAHRTPKPSAAPVAEVEAEAPGPGPAEPVVADPWRIKPAGAEHYHTVPHIRAHVAGRVAEINQVGSRAVDIHISVVEERTARRNAINLRRNRVGDHPRTYGRRGHKPYAIVAAVVTRA